MKAVKVGKIRQRRGYMYLEGAYMQVALMLRGPQQFENLGRAPRKEPKACRYSNEPSII